MAETRSLFVGKWDTLHENGPNGKPFDLKRQYITRLASEAKIRSKLGRYNDVAKEIQKLIKECSDNNEGFRAYGSRWSMSSIAYQEENMHQNNLMNLDLDLDPEDFHANCTDNYRHEDVFFFECGNTIKQISQRLGRFDKSLKASGASNGQTIVGCISTGVHGSAFDVGSVQDYVIGLNIITGPNPEDIVYLERHTRPALSDIFAQKIKAKVIRNDELFNAALVSLGSFGFIHGVVIEAEDIFLLHRYVRKIDKNLALELSQNLDFKNSIFKIPEEVDASGKPLRPYHYKVFINPYVNDSKYVVEVMYKKPYTPAYEDPLSKIEKSIYRDLIYLMVKFSEKFPKSIPWFIKRLEKQILPDVEKNEEKIIGTLYETFWDAPYKGAAFACSVAVDQKDSKKALETLVEMTKKDGPIPGIFAMRYVKQTEATLGFTKFDRSCVIEIDGIQWKKTNKILSLEEYGRRMIEVLKQKNIEFTVHWGKNIDWAFPNLAKHMYGNKVDTWKKCRSWLLSDKMAKTFSNDFIATLGLSKKENNVPQDFIVSMDKNGNQIT